MQKSNFNNSLSNHHGKLKWSVVIAFVVNVVVVNVIFIIIIEHVFLASLFSFSLLFMIATTSSIAMRHPGCVVIKNTCFEANKCWTFSREWLFLGQYKGKHYFLVACYATLHPALSVCLLSIHPSVRPSVYPSYYFFKFLRSLASLLLPKWSSDLKYCPCPPARDWGSRVSGLVDIRCSSHKFGELE